MADVIVYRTKVVSAGARAAADYAARARANELAAEARLNEATVQATNAGLAAAIATAAQPFYVSQAAGEAATTQGQYFRVGNGGVLITYQRLLSGSAELFRMPVLDPTGKLVIDSGRVDINGGHSTTRVKIFSVAPNTDYSPTVNIVAGLPGLDFGGGGITCNIADYPGSAPVKPFAGSGYFVFRQDGLIQFANAPAGSAPTVRLQIAPNGVLLPGQDNAYSIGFTGSRFSTIYLVTSPVLTSDEREKTWRGGLTAAEKAAAIDIGRAIGLFQWDDAIAQKGADADAGGARLHVGVKAQQVWGIMRSHGLLPATGTSSKYAFLCCDDLGDGADRYGVRTDQLALFVMAGMVAELLP